MELRHHCYGFCSKGHYFAKQEAYSLRLHHCIISQLCFQTCIPPYFILAAFAVIPGDIKNVLPQKSTDGVFYTLAQRASHQARPLRHQAGDEEQRDKGQLVREAEPQRRPIRVRRQRQQRHHQAARLADDGAAV